jgi:hypothetical protein
LPPAPRGLSDWHVEGPTSPYRPFLPF